MGLQHGGAMTRLGCLALSLWLFLLQPTSATEKPAHIKESMHRLHLQSLRIQRLEAPEFDPVDTSFSTALASAISSTPVSTHSSALASMTQRLKGHAFSFHRRPSAGAVVHVATRHRDAKHHTRVHST